MSSYTQFTQQVGTAILDAARQVQNAVVQAVEGVDGLVAKLPGLPDGTSVPLADRLAGLPGLPTLPGLPSAREVVSAHFDLTERLLAAQRAFALRLVTATAESARVFVPAQATAPQQTPAGAGV